MFKRTSLLLLTTLMIASLLAACGGRTGGGDNTAQQSGKIKIITWSNPPTVEAIKKINAAFEKKYPNIKVDFTTVPTNNYLSLQTSRIAAQDADIMAIQGLTAAPKEYTPGAAKPQWQQWADANVFEDLTNEAFVKNYYPQAIQDGSTYNGKVISLTSGSYPLTGMFYNKDLFAKYNLKEPTTWNELMDASKTIQAQGIAPFTIGGKESWPVSVATEGIRDSLFQDREGTIKGLWDGSFKYTDPKYVNFLTRSQQLLKYTEKGFMGIDSNTAAARFAAGKAAMLPAGSWDGPLIAKTNPSLKFSYIPVPGSDNATDNAKFGGKYDLAWTILSKAKNKDGARKWLEFFSAPENYTTYVNAVGIVPSQPNIKVDSPFINELAPKVADMHLAYSSLIISRKNAGKYASASTALLSPAGTVPTPQELAQKAQADWDAAAPKK